MTQTLEHYPLPKPDDPATWTPPAVIPHHHDEACDCEPTIMYIRVSKVGERDPETLLSPDIQLTSGLQFCQARNKRIVQVITDINASGRTFRKRSVDDVIKLIKNGVAASVLLWKWSRWGRNVEASKGYLGKIHAVGGAVHVATEDFDQNTAIGRLSTGMIMQFDEFYSDQISDGWRAVHEQRRINGLPHTGRKRFGYDYISKASAKAGRGHPGSRRCGKCAVPVAHFLVNDVEGPMLRSLYMRYMAGVSLRRMARELNESGFRTPPGGPWTREALGQMLDTGFGAGWIRERSAKLIAMTKAQGKRVRNALTSFDIWRRGAHDAVISEAEWEVYKAHKLERATVPPRSHEAAHPLSTLLFCQLCSRRLSTHYAGSTRIHTWVCTQGEVQHPKINVSITNSLAMSKIREWVQANAEPPKAVDIDALARAALRAVPSTARTLEQVDADIAKENRAIGKLVTQNARELISDGEFMDSKNEIEASIASLETERRKLIAQVGPVGKPDYEAFGLLAEQWDQLVTMEAPQLNSALREIIAFAIVSPPADRSMAARRSPDRVEVIGQWDRASKDAWLVSCLRRRMSA